MKAFFNLLLDGSNDIGDGNDGAVTTSSSVENTDAVASSQIEIDIRNETRKNPRKYGAASASSKLDVKGRAVGARVKLLQVAAKTIHGTGSFVDSLIIQIFCHRRIKHFY